jgi:hypothetical protein
MRLSRRRRRGSTTVLAPSIAFTTDDMALMFAAIATW